MIIRPNTRDAGVSVDLTPIIDMVFLLLIFFLVATTFHQTEREMQIALPVAKHGGPISASLREIVINVAADGSIIVSGRTVDREQLRAMIADAADANPDQKVTIRGDRTTPYDNVAAVLDICKGAGIQQPYLDTELR